MENNRWEYLKPKQSKDEEYFYEIELLELVNISIFSQNDEYTVEFVIHHSNRLILTS
jgi:hypothetical protein